MTCRGPWRPWAACIGCRFRVEGLGSGLGVFGLGFVTQLEFGLGLVELAGGACQLN